MSASDHLHPGQLQMFMPARQVFETHALADSRAQGERSRHQTMRTKEHENQKYGDPDMGEPVTISHDPWPGSKGRPVVYDGHHRLAKGMRTNAEIPLQHIDDDNWRTL